MCFGRHTQSVYTVLNLSILHNLSTRLWCAEVDVVVVVPPEVPARGRTRLGGVGPRPQLPFRPSSPPVVSTSSGIVSTSASLLPPGLQVADLSLEEFVGVVRSIVREDRGAFTPGAITPGVSEAPVSSGVVAISSAPGSGAPRAASLSVSWSLPSVSSTLAPSAQLVAPLMTPLPVSLPGAGAGMNVR